MTLSITKLYHYATRAQILLNMLSLLLRNERMPLTKLFTEHQKNIFLSDIRGQCYKTFLSVNYRFS
jgi:hypothetical protein